MRNEPTLPASPLEWWTQKLESAGRCGAEPGPYAQTADLSATPSAAVRPLHGSMSRYLCLCGAAGAAGGFGAACGFAAAAAEAGVTPSSSTSKTSVAPPGI